MNCARPLFLALVAGACAPAVQTANDAPDTVPPRVAAVFPAAWRYPPGQDATFAEHAMVASNSRLASEAGVEILRAGGNAVDAAVAVGFALTVSLPEAGNIGGGGYMVIRLADGRTAAIDYREVAPAAASRDMYMDSTGTLTRAGVVGRAASGVPGSVAGLTAALARYGTMSLDKVMAPAIRMAADGIVVDSALAASVANKQTLIRQFAGNELFSPGGMPPAVGARLVQRDLAGTLRIIAREGAAGFYRGRVAQLIASELQRDCPPALAGRHRASRACGIITVRDLEQYQPVWREPLRTTYRGYTLISMPPSSSGGVTLSESLNILEPFASLSQFGTARYFHLVASAFQRAFIDRNAKLGDPAFATVPIAQLTSKEYALELHKTISPDRHTPTATLPMHAGEGTETTHYSVVDAHGNAVATTTTINSTYGSGVLIRGAGFFMNNVMDDFTSQPGKPNQFGLVQGENNAIAPGKRMLSAMSPTIVLDPRGDVLLVLGARGGPRIITSTAQVILNVIDNRMTLSDALRAPRIHHQALPDTLKYEPDGLDPATMEKLGQMGYALARQGIAEAKVTAIMRVRGGYVGMDDPRSAGAAVGY
ncbi:MAG TPA: gamma-glutamyltransferase [Gemmatimonadaceae bacterium]|nr:gamma-glutamyltransferase [Gemmatimonadaceae bacterium]